MRRLVGSDLPSWVFVGVLFSFGLALRLYCAWQPIPILIERGMSDDAFYYLTIARNIVLGKGISFDGIFPTNGFHPLYLILLTITMKLTSFFGEITSHEFLQLNVQLGQTILMLFNGGVALPLYGFLKRLINPQAALVALVFWLFNPWVTLISLTGVETSLYIFWGGLTVYFYLIYRTELTNKRLALVGILGGLTILGRTDGIFLMIAIGGDLLTSSFRSVAPCSWLKNLDRYRIYQLCLMLVCCFAVISPWLIWNLINFSTVAQVSGLAVYQHTHQNLNWAVGNLLGVMAGSTVDMALIASILNYPMFVLLLIIIAGCFLQYRDGKMKSISIRPSFHFLYFYAALIFAFYAWYLLRKQLWYFMPILFVAAIAVAALHQAFSDISAIKTERGGWLLVSFEIIVLLAASAVGWWIWQSGLYVVYPAQRNGYVLAEWLAHNTNIDARIGAWNSGLLGYFSNRTVVNLDGVVNNHLYEYIQQRGASFYDLENIWDYIQEMNIEYLTDYEDMEMMGILPLAQRSRLENKLELIHQFPCLHNQGNYLVRVFRLVVP